MPASATARPQQKAAERTGPERLQKILAHAGIGSRRSCEDVILQGRVTVDGQVVRELGTKVDPARQKVAVDGQRVHAERPVYYAVSKPKGYVSTNHDPAGKPRVVDILPEIPQRVYTVGRLDEQSTGLMLLTNDGEMANRLTHPKFGVEKLYRVIVAGSPAQEVLTKLTEGVWLAEGKVRAKRVRIVGTRGEATILEMTLAEGKNREVRRMMAGLGHKVMSLTRTAVGPITLKGLAPGEYRTLTPAEVGLLRKVAAGIPVAPSRDYDRPRPPRRGVGRTVQQAPRTPSARGPFTGQGPGPRLAGGPPPRPAPEVPLSRGPHRAPVRPDAPRSRASDVRRPAAGPSGARPPRPPGPPPPQRQFLAPPPRPRLAQLPQHEPDEPRRRIIGMEHTPPPPPAPTRPAQRGPFRPAPKRRPHPRPALGPRRPRPTKGDDDQG